MKNIFILPTNGESRLQLKMNGELHLENGTSISLKSYQHIYITSDEEAYPYALHLKKGEILKINGVGENSKEIFHSKGFNFPNECKKIILTTDPKLIADGVQEIDDNFLNWFVNNSSCEYVEVTSLDSKLPKKEVNGYFTNETLEVYKIITPKKTTKKIYEMPLAIHDIGKTCITTKEEPKQQSIEDLIESAAKTFSNVYKEEKEKQTAFVEFKHGAYFIAKRMYGEVFEWLASKDYLSDSVGVIQKEFEQFKKITNEKQNNHI